MNELGDFLKTISEGKKDAIKSNPGKKALKQLEQSLHADNPFLNLLAEQPVDLPPQQPKVEVIGEFILEQGTFTHSSTLNEVITPEIKPASQQVPMDVIDKYLKQNASFQQPNPELVDPSIKAVQEKLKFLEQAIGRIAATGPGSGEVNLRWLDDVKRDTIADGRWLKYSAADKKFVFDEINPYEVVHNTTEVTTSTYTVQDTDYYIGVNYSGPVTITLPASASSGRLLVIKDEDGDAETNPITVLGTVDNDPGGFVIQLNNGAIQMIYRNGWRII